jgi:hypothetical protein
LDVLRGTLGYIYGWSSSNIVFNHLQLTMASLCEGWSNKHILPGRNWNRAEMSSLWRNKCFWVNDFWVIYTTHPDGSGILFEAGMLHYMPCVAWITYNVLFALTGILCFIIVVSCISIVMFCTVRSIGIFCFTRCFCCVYQDSDVLYCSFYWYILFH